MQLYDQILGQLKEAMKSKEEQRRDTLRLLQSAIKNEAIEKRQPPEELSDEQVVAVVKRMVKQRKDSIEQYRAGGRKIWHSKRWRNSISSPNTCRKACLRRS